MVASIGRYDTNPHLTVLLGQTGSQSEQDDTNPHRRVTETSRSASSWTGSAVLIFVGWHDPWRPGWHGRVSSGHGSRAAFTSGRLKGPLKDSAYPSLPSDHVVFI